ncbi:hypothetical protein [Mycobacteroides abscessus]|uniref:hypothetical protein n=1 Tax=Mycobacteroides abscessus TaxID=36809 RepID=UPI00092B3676|nr:hypothetical protein [Mycobacteroides abscessus]MDO3145494.1 hypothetical protein [Mycobacteroides abscessus subsp. massiliense]MDO3306410.1 hypothetical protein [Mycobacteroides abscessus subsp. massiliense]SIM15454.1 Uncharacterised protein [Mycobacteroides abscessus subsp. abscessus]
MTNINDITKLIEASSLGTRSARAARRSVTAAQGEAIARRAARSGKDKEEFRGTGSEGTYRSVSGSTTGQIEGKENTMAKGHNRSAVTGRYVTAASAKRSPKTTVTEQGANHSNGTHHRSAITGKFVKGSTAARHPDTTVTERG